MYEYIDKSLREEHRLRVLENNVLRWTPFQTHYFSENLVAPEIEPGHLNLWLGTLTTRPQRRSRKGNRLKFP
jgi:hypothetical protein